MTNDLLVDDDGLLDDLLLDDVGLHDNTAAAPQARSFEQLHHLPATLTVELDRLTLPLAEIQRLGVDDVLLLDLSTGSALPVRVNGKLVGFGDIQDNDNQLSLRLTHLPNNE